MNTFSIKSGDTRPSLEAQLLDETNTPRNLQTVDTVKFHMKNVNTQEVVVNGAGSVLSESDGKVVYEWKDGDTDTTGQHKAEFEITYTDGETETFPNGEDINVFVERDIA